MRLKSLSLAATFLLTTPYPLPATQSLLMPPALGCALSPTMKIDCTKNHPLNQTLAQNTGQDRRAEADQLLQQGLQYLSASQYKKAQEFLGQALASYRTLNDRPGEVAGLINLGLSYGLQNQYEQAIDYYQQALLILQQENDRYHESLVLNALGHAYQALYRYELAIDYHQRALPIFQDLKNRQGEAWILMNLGISYWSLSQHDRAIPMFQQALPIFRQVGNLRGEAAALTNLGITYGALSQYQQAIASLQQGLPIFQQLNDRSSAAAVLMNLGNTYRSLSQYEQAIHHFQQALPLFQQVKDVNGEAKVLINLGVTYEELAEYDQAIAYYQRVLPIVQATKNRSDEALTLGNWGSALYRRGDLAIAETTLYASISLQEAIRADLKQDQSKVSVFESQQDAYRTLQQVLIAQGKVEQALEIAERGRARAFVELLQRRGNGLKTDETDGGNGLKTDGGNGLKTGETHGKSVRPTANLSVSSATPSAAKPITIAEIKQIARDQNATLVQYSIIPDQKQGESLYIWVIKSSGQIAFQQVNLKTALNGKTLDELVLGGREDIGNSRGRGIGWQEDPATVNSAIAQVTSQANQQPQRNPNLQALHEMLIVPIASHLPTDPHQRVIVVPQGGLFLVPFPALQAKDLTYLIDKHTILTAPAIQVLQLTRSQRLRLGVRGRASGIGSRESPNAQHPTPNALVVGNPAMPPLSLVPGEPPRSLSSLPESAKEAVAIAPLLGTTALLGQQATKAVVVKQMQTARLIHLATHGIFDSQQGLQSGIVLAADGTGQPNDGLLTAGEILDLELRAELVVLSACDTGRGKITGDGVIGLSRSLISAGVSSVLVSLWAVDDGATSELMQVFYQQLQQPGTDKARALRQAMLVTKAEYPGVAYWAAFTLIGETE